VGANYQFWGGAVVGVEAMFDWFTVSHNNPVTATDPTNTVAVTWDRVLLYAKGGGAWVATTSPSISIAGGSPASFSSVNNTAASTWTAGFGLEWAFSGNWSVAGRV
jgi:opacity protein-like surface antigen